MPTPKQVVRYGLFNFTCIFPEPIYVLEHLFCVIGNGFEWNANGELEEVFENRDYDCVQMDYSDLDEQEAYAKTMKDQECLNDLYNAMMLKVKAGRARRRFIEENIDIILSSPLTSTFFEEFHRGGSYVTDHISPDYARGLNFPDHINKEWGDELYRFLDHWLVALNTTYGVSQKDYNDVSFWPKNAQEGRKSILAAKERLFPLINNGKTYAEHIEESKQFSKRLLAELDNLDLA